MITDPLNLTSGFAIIGHRGATGLAPENTLPSFQIALDLGCRGIELDVHPVVDANDLVQLGVIHDTRLDRTTNQRGLVANVTAEALSVIDAGNGAGVPLLGEVVELIGQPNTTLLNIELKGKKAAAPTAAFLAQRPELRALVSSFDHNELRLFRSLDSATAVAPLFSRNRTNLIDTARTLNATSINVAYSMVDEPLLETCRDAGYPVLVYTVNRLQDAQRMKSLGVAGIFTDRPDLMLELQE
jgi:glycerophosphoryl diester phosphodiesterase